MTAFSMGMQADSKAENPFDPRDENENYLAFNEGFDYANRTDETYLFSSRSY